MGCQYPLFSLYVFTDYVVSIILASYHSCLSTSDILTTICLLHRYYHKITVSIVPHLFCLSLTSQPQMSPSSRIYVSTFPVDPHLHIRACPLDYSPLPFYVTPIILYLCRLFAILPHFCFSHNHIIFH